MMLLRFPSNHSVGCNRLGLEFPQNIKMAVQVEPATLSDVPRLAEIFQLSFNDEYMTKLFPPTPEGRAYVSKAYENFIQKTAQDSRVFVVRDEEGKCHRSQ